MPNNVESSLSAASAVAIPQYVVFRAFAAETIMLNLQTGTYHGLNPTAGKMLETLQQHEVISEAAAAITDHYSADAAVVESDMLALCSGLVERGLLVVKADA